MIVLIDSGSSHSFVNNAFLKRVNMTREPVKPAQVKVANGYTLLSNKWIPQMQWWAKGYTFTDMRVLDLGAYDAILGFDWLKQHQHM